MKKLTLLTLLVTLSCTHYQKDNFRELASEEVRANFHDNPYLARNFNQVFQTSEEPSEQFIELLHGYRDLFFHNQALTYAYDEALKQDIDPIETPLYAELWIGRHEKEHALEFLTYTVTKLEDLSVQYDNPESDKAAMVLERLYEELQALPEYDKLAFVDLAEVVKDLETPETVRRKSVGQPDLKRPFEHFLQEDFAWKDFYQANQEELREQAELRAPKRSLERLYKGGSNQKRMIAPSTSSQGNLIGGEFPRGVWSLTYDDGPHSQRTPAILRLLDQAGIKASFFWLAQRAPQNRSIVQMAKSMGMELANHSYSHANMPQTNQATRYREIVESTDVLEQVYGQRVKFFRLPYGAGVNNQDIRRMIADRGMIHVFWNVDSLDWQDRNPYSILRRVTEQMEQRGSGIILFHDIQAPTVEVTAELIHYANQRNQRQPGSVQFKTLEQIVGQLNNAPAPQGPYTTANLNVRLGPSTDYQTCAVLPQGTPVRIVERFQGTPFVRIEVPSASASLRQSCGRSLFVSGSFIRE